MTRFLLWQMGWTRPPLNGVAQERHDEGVSSSHLTVEDGSMEQITMIGIDLAKQVFQIHGVDRHGNARVRKQFRRSQLLPWLAQLPPCIVAMEACRGAHHWARRLQRMGHDVRLIPPQHVKAFVRGQKNDPDREWGPSKTRMLRPSIIWRAALHGDHQALSSVGRCYYHGIGVTKDRRVAWVWLDRAKEFAPSAKSWPPCGTSAQVSYSLSVCLSARCAALMPRPR